MVFLLKRAKFIGRLCVFFFYVEDKPFEMIEKFFLNIGGGDFVWDIFKENNWKLIWVWDERRWQIIFFQFSTFEKLYLQGSNQGLFSISFQFNFKFSQYVMTIWSYLLIYRIRPYGQGQGQYPFDLDKTRDGYQKQKWAHISKLIFNFYDFSAKLWKSEDIESMYD